MLSMLKRLWRDKSGDDNVEYALLVALIALAVIATIYAYGTSISNAYDRVPDALHAGASTANQASGSGGSGGSGQGSSGGGNQGSSGQSGGSGGSNQGTTGQSGTGGGDQGGGESNSPIKLAPLK